MAPYADHLHSSVPYTPFFAHTNGYAALAAESPEQCMAVAYEDLKVPFCSYCHKFSNEKIPVI